METGVNKCVLFERACRYLSFTLSSVRDMAALGPLARRYRARDRLFSVSRVTQREES